MTNRRTTAAWAAVLGWCALTGWFAFARSTRVPLLWCVDLGFHELGHLVMYILPIHEVLTAAMGSIFQCMVPLGIGAYFWFVRRDGIGATVCLAWTATNFQDVSVYIADAPVQKLQLIGGEHDWGTILGPQHFDNVQSAGTIAQVVRTIGLLLWCAAVVGAVRGLLFSFGATGSSSGAVGPVAATVWTPDDRLPNR
jgi:hypothetical protein